jgi:hypothetical protein
MTEAAAKARARRVFDLRDFGSALLKRQSRGVGFWWDAVTVSINFFLPFSTIFVRVV